MEPRSHKSAATQTRVVDVPKHPGNRKSAAAKNSSTAKTSTPKPGRSPPPKSSSAGKNSIPRDPPTSPWIPFNRSSHSSGGHKQQQQPKSSLKPKERRMKADIGSSSVPTKPARSISLPNASTSKLIKDYSNSGTIGASPSDDTRSSVSVSVSRSQSRSWTVSGRRRGGGVALTRRFSSGPIQLGDAAAGENVDLGPYLLEQARLLFRQGDDLQRALEYALRAANSLEASVDEDDMNSGQGIELVTCLHLVAAIHCAMGHYEDAVLVLQRSLEVTVLEESLLHALAAFAGRMSLGDIFSMMGQLELAIQEYRYGLELQKQYLGDNDPNVADTCIHIAETMTQAQQLKQAQQLCQEALNIHRELCPASPQEISDRRLMAILCQGLGDHDAALEHLALASICIKPNIEDHDDFSVLQKASIDFGIGDAYLALGQFNEASFAYHKSLAAFKSAMGDHHPSVAKLFVKIADMHYRTGKKRACQTYCENALEIYNNPSTHYIVEDVALGLTEVATVFEALDQPGQALLALHKARRMLVEDGSGQNGAVIAGIEAELGVAYSVLGRYGEAYSALASAAATLRGWGEWKSPFFGTVLNQMGLVCVHLDATQEAVDLFQESRSIMDEVCGIYHPEALAVCNNLAAAYDATGRLEDAIEIMEHVVKAREERPGTVGQEANEERRRLGELLKEAGRTRSKYGKSLETLIGSNVSKPELLKKESSTKKRTKKIVK